MHVELAQIGRSDPAACVPTGWAAGDPSVACVHVLLVRTGPAASEVVAAAVDGGADLVALASHGPDGALAVVPGSAVAGLLGRGACPVLAVRV